MVVTLKSKQDGDYLFLANAILSFATDGGGDTAVSPIQVGLFAGADGGNLKRRAHIVELYDSVRPSLFAYLCCIGLTSEEAEDVIQESFLRLVRSFPDGGAEQNLRGWLFRVAHNASMDLFRSGRRRDSQMSTEEDSFVQAQVDLALTPEELVIKKEQLRHLRAAMSCLTSQQRYAVLLRAEGLRYREIAAVLEISTQRVAELVQRALVRLAGEL